VAKLIDPACYAGEAVHRARSMVNNGGQYVLGTGNYAPRFKGAKVIEDVPWTPYWDKSSSWYNKLGSDCAGFAICWAWKLRRYRPGFNQGSWSSVVDHINCNSALEDGLHTKKLFETLPEGAQLRPGDLITYPTIYVKVDGKKRQFVGHVGLVELVPLDFKYGDWRRLGIIQCHGPNGYKPGVVRSDGSVWAHHDTLWGKLEHRTRIVRPHDRPEAKEWK
jgi:hypothetical protein